MKKITTLLTAATIVLASSTGCTKTESSSDRYFRFKANGVQYDYKYECENSWTGTSTCSFGAFQSKTTAWGGTYQIYGASFKEKTAEGEVRFFLNKEDFNTKDTIILDGVRNIAKIYNLNYGSNNYIQNDTNTGRIIFLSKTNGILKAQFHFFANQQYDKSLISITEGAFQVGRLN